MRLLLALLLHPHQMLLITSRGEHQVTVDDILWGCAAIAEVIGQSTRQTFYLLEQLMIPARKVGKKWVASRRALMRALGAGEEQSANT
jgi:hypothetical protein